MTQTRLGNPRFPAWKFEAPQLGRRLLTRERLLSTVEECLGGTKMQTDVLLVSAPAGYGKTTLLAQWALRTNLPVVWYHLSPSDQDPANLLRGVVRALRRTFPRPRWNTESLLDDLRADVLSGSDLVRACTALLADIEQYVLHPAVLILTDVAELGGSAPALAVVDRLLSRPLEHLRLTLEWREAPQIRVSRLIAQQRIQTISRDDLALTVDELDRLLAVYGAPTDVEYRDQVQRLTAGWLTGAILAIGAQASLSAPSLIDGELDQELVTNYLAQQVISVLPPELRTFATQVAILNYMTTSICARLLGVPITLARKRLGALQRATGFVSRNGKRAQSVIYRLQPQFRQALLSWQSDLREEVEQQRLALHRRAAEIFEEEQEYEEAIGHHAASGNFERIANLIDAVQGEYLRVSCGLVLTRWLDMLPPPVLESRPHLALLQAELYRQSGHSRQALALAEAVYQRVRPDGHRASEDATPVSPATYQLAARAAIICAEVPRDQSTSVMAQESCREALSWLDYARKSGDTIAVPESLYARAYETLSALVLLTDGGQAAEPYLEACAQHALASGDLWQVGRHHYYQSKVYISQGNFERAESAAAAALLAAQEAHDERCAISSRLNLGAIKMRLGRSQEAHKELESALVAAESAGYVIGRLYAFSNLADLARSCGDYPQAIHLYEETLEGLLSIEDPHLRMCALAGLGYALTLSGRAEEALVRLTPLLEPALEPNGPRLKIGSYDQLVVALSLGFAYLRHGLASYASKLLLQAEETARHLQDYLRAARAHVFLAALWLANTDEDGAEVEVRRAFDYALQVPDGLALAVELRMVPEVWPLFERFDHPLAADLVREAQRGQAEISR